MFDYDIEPVPVDEYNLTETRYEVWVHNPHTGAFYNHNRGWRNRAVAERVGRFTAFLLNHGRPEPGRGWTQFELAYEDVGDAENGPRLEQCLVPVARTPT